MKNPNLIFAGTPEFAVASLAALVDSGVKPSLVLTQPDRPAGRGKRLTPSPVKRYAEAHAIPVSQPLSLKGPDAVAALREQQPDLLVVAAYGLILPQAVLDVPSVDCVNVHASLLPRWRGAAPIQAAILAGDTETGVCLMRMTAGLDCGPVFAKTTVPIAPTLTAGELHDQLALAGGQLLAERLADIAAGDVLPVEQDESAVTYAGKIRTADAKLDWSRPAIELDRVVRAYNPVPGAWFMLGDERLKCWAAQPIAATGGTPGSVIAVTAGAVDVACGQGVLRLTRLQRPGKRAADAGVVANQIDFRSARL